MSYKSDFENDEGWSVVDTNIKLNTARGKKFQDFLKETDANTIIRYYASSRRSKTISLPEAKLLSNDNFNILPVYQDRHRQAGDFGSENGKASAGNALAFTEYIGQPEGSTIVFAVDTDFSQSQVEQHIVPYFKAIASEIGSAFRIGAYGSGLVLSTLIEEGLIEIPWISMSRAFRGTREFFYSEDWAMRQVPPDRTHGDSRVSYDRNVINWPIEELGAFRLDEEGNGHIVRDEGDDATLGGGGDGVAAGPQLDVANAYVSTEGLNLRTGPNGAIIRALTIGQPVNDLGAADNGNWRRVEIDGERGVVFGKYLRQPSTPEVEALLQQTIEEWVRFDKGRAHEETNPFYTYVGEMWASIGESYDGRSRYPDGTEVPWSAAFISFVVRSAGRTYDNFKFSAAHSVFSHDAIQSRFMSRTDKPFWGYRSTEQRPEIGDIIHRNRGGNTYSFDYAENHSNFSSHADLVVEVTSHVARVIGGNVGDTVTMRRVTSSGDNIQEYDLDSNGYLEGGQRVIAVLKNRASEVV